MKAKTLKKIVMVLQQYDKNKVFTNIELQDIIMDVIDGMSKKKKSNHGLHNKMD